MAAEIKYSVIVPVYNRAHTLKRCLESLTAPLRQDVQILVVDDGSEDASLAIAKEFALRYPNVSSISLPHSGVSVARNAGLEQAKGTYVTFVDSDDYVAPDYFDLLDSGEEADLLVFAHQILDTPDPGRIAALEKLSKLSTKERRLRALLSNRWIMTLWNKRFLRSRIEDLKLRFIPGMQIGEDFNFTMAYALSAQSIGFCPRCILHNDPTDPNSLSRKYRPGLEDQLVWVFSCLNELQGIDPYRDILDYLFARSAFTGIAETFKEPSIDGRTRLYEICEKFRTPLTSRRCGPVHRLLRLLLRLRCYHLLYFVAEAVKGKAFREQFDIE